MKEYIEIKFIGNWNNGEEAAYRATLYDGFSDDIGVKTQIFHAPWDAPLYVVGYLAVEAVTNSWDEEDIPVYSSHSGRKIYSRNWERRAQEWEYDWYERCQESKRKRKFI